MSLALIRSSPAVELNPEQAREADGTQFAQLGE